MAAIAILLLATAYAASGQESDDAAVDLPHDRPPVVKQGKEVPGLKDGFSAREFPISGLLTSVGFSPDGKYVAGGCSGNGNIHGSPEAGYWNGDLIVWEVKTGKTIAAKRFNQHVKTVQFTADGKGLAVLCSSRNRWGERSPNALGFKLRPARWILYQFPEMEERAKIDLEAIGESFHMATDEHRVAFLISYDVTKDSGFESQAVRILDWRSPEKFVEVSPVSLVPSDQPGFMFVEEGRKIAILIGALGQSGSGRYRLFDCETGKDEGEFFGPKDVANGAFMADFAGESRLYHTGSSFVDLDETQKRAETTHPSFMKLQRGTLLTISADRKRTLGVDWKNLGPNRTKQYIVWADRTEKVTTEVFEFQIYYTRFVSARFSPVNSDLFAVGLSLYYEPRAMDGRRSAVVLFEKLKNP